MNKRLLKDVVLFGAGLYLGGMWVKAKITEAFIEMANKDIPEKKEQTSYYRGALWNSKESVTEFIFPTRKEAEAILDKMKDIVSEYGHVTLADLYALTGNVADYTYNKKGWINLRKAGIVRVANGYMLYMPKMVNLGV